MPIEPVCDPVFLFLSARRVHVNDRRASNLPDAERVANAFGYTSEQLQSVPDEAHIGLSCGNPVAAASIKEVGDELLLCSTTG